MWTEARGRGFTPADLARWMSAEPARLAGLDATKGAIAPGRDADLVVWDTEPRWTVEVERLHQRHAVTPYAGLGLVGRVARTYLRGRLVQDSGRFVAAPAGRLLTRTAQRAPAVG
jgi:allantoinase